MVLSRQHKLLIISLVLYWPSLFVLAHVPIPGLIRQAGVSDKSLHFLSYMILAVLFWSAINPHTKVNWRKATVWWMLILVIWYGVIDEWLQSFVTGRSADIRDFLADIAGTLAGLAILTVLSSWPAFLIITCTTIFTLTNFSGANWINVMPVTNIAFDFFAYTFLTILWIQYLRISFLFRAPEPKWFLAAMLPPMAFLLTVKLGSLIFDKDVAVLDIIVSTIGIAIIVTTTGVIALSHQRTAKTQELSTAKS